MPMTPTGVRLSVVHVQSVTRRNELPRAVRMLSRASVAARAANETIRATVLDGTTGPIPFQCECGRDHCRSNVWLTVAEAAHVIDRHGLIIAVHEPGR